MTELGLVVNRARALGDRISVSAFGFTVASIATVFAVSVLLSALTGIVYHQLRYDGSGPVDSYLAGGLLVAAFYLLPRLNADRLALERVVDGALELDRMLIEWAAAFAAFAVVLVITKSNAVHSRGWLIAYFATGFVVVPLLEIGIRRLARLAIGAGVLQARKIFLVGVRADLQRLAGTVRGSRVARAVGVREISLEAAPEVRASQLAEAVATARSLGVRDVVLVMPAQRADLVAAAVEAFSVLPVSVHFDVSALRSRFGDLSVHRIGGLSALAVDEAPLGPWSELVKRTFDIVFSGLALVLLSPLMLLVAVLIRRDSPGDVFFRQSRRGYNQREFTILKFRTMRPEDPNAPFRQAQAGDMRITRVGRWLRRTNLDELPQLINVLRGEMSLVGPRPHAVDHDLQFEDRIRAYPRRLNVRPGITGWAQINGLRGETDTDEKMARRVEHDLYYIDNWSLWLDLFIIAATVVSPKSYRNAR